MKRFLIYYNNGLLEQRREINHLFERLIMLGIITFIVDTKHGVVMSRDTAGNLASCPIVTCDAENTADTRLEQKGS